MNFIEQAIENCHMTHKYENPGMENGMCAGLRTMSGEGEPPGKCKECRLYYGYAEEHDIKQTNADRIRSMSDEELAEFLCNVNQYSDMEVPTKEECGVMIDWLQSEVEE